MAHWVMSTGAMAYLIPAPAAGGPTSLRDLVADFSGLILQGGSDVSPRSYGEEALRPEWNGDPVRDEYESALLREFMSAGRPVLGVCRGLQLLNVALGGTLYQDIATQLPGAINHRDWEIYDQNFHELEVEAGSRLAALYPGQPSWKVNTVHHQAIKGLAPGLTIEARSRRDGIIEAVRHEGKAWVQAVQWHPEFHDPRDSSLLSSQPLLQEFLKRCSA